MADRTAVTVRNMSITSAKARLITNCLDYLVAIRIGRRLSDLLLGIAKSLKGYRAARHLKWPEIDSEVVV